MRNDYEEIRTSVHRDTFDRFVAETSRSANYFVLTGDPPVDEMHRQQAALLIMGSAFKAGLIEGKLSESKSS